MRIKSPFKDYYDCVQGYGQDDILWVRYPKEIIDGPLPCYNLRYFNDKFYDNVVIAFCGKMYIGYRFRIEKSYMKYEQTKWMYNVDEVKKVYQENDWDYSFSNWSKSIPQIMEEFEQKYKVVPENIQTVFKEYQTPVFLCSRRKLIEKHNKESYFNVTDVNPILRNFDFHRVFSPQLAYQEIRMFMSNMASPEKPIPKIDDVTMAEAKGFDKWSFRKMPQKNH